jgi:hypothetical protein
MGRDTVRGILLGIAVTLAVTVPASAQYRFDRTVDPIMCAPMHDICDYGGRAIIRYRASHERCPLVEVDKEMPDGSVVTKTVRQCPLRVRG